MPGKKFRMALIVDVDEEAGIRMTLDTPGNTMDVDKATPMDILTAFNFFRSAYAGYFLPPLDQGE